MTAQVLCIRTPGGKIISSDSSTAWQLLELLYRSPGNVDGWREFLSALCNAMPTEAVGVLVGAPRPGRTGIFISNEIRATEEIHEIVASLAFTPQPDEARTLSPGSLHIIPPSPYFEPFENSRIYSELFISHGIRSSGFVGMPLGHDHTGLVHTYLMILSRSEWSPSVAETSLLSQLGPHIVRAARLHDKLIRAEMNETTILAALDHLVLGVLLLDRNGDVAYANQSAAELLESSAGLADLSVLGTSQDRRTEYFKKWLGRDGSPPAGASHYPHPRDSRSLHVLTSPMKWELQDGEATQRIANMVFIGDPKSDSSGPIELLGDLYGLTPAESRIALKLMADHSLSDTAEKLGITIETARTTLKRIFAKTGTHRQGSLIRLLLTTLGQVRRPE